MAVVTANSHSNAGPTGSGNPVTDFQSFASQVRNDLSPCTNSAALVQVELGGLLVNPNASNVDLVQLDTDSKSAQTACDEAKDDKLSNLLSLSPPSSIGYIQSLSGASGAALLWATDDTTAVLHDLQRVAESSGNDVAIESQLTTDVTRTDSDAALVRYDFSNAASRLGIKSFSGVGLVVWGSDS